MSNSVIKTKVLYVITKSNFGGAQKYVYELATSLSQEQFDVVVAVGGEGILVNKLRKANIRTISIPVIVRDVNPFKDLIGFFFLFKLFKSERPSVVHLNSAKVSGLGALAARFARVPKIIFTAHGWAFNEDRSLFQQIIIKFFSWLTILLSHKTICVSDAVRKNISNWPFIQNKVIVIKNGVKEFDFIPKDEALLELSHFTKISLPSNAFIVGTIAELHKNKGLSYAIEAFDKIIKEHESLYYLILGGGEEEDALKRLIKEKKLEDRVFLCGFVDNAPKYLKVIDVLLMPSITEGLALVLLEAGLAKVPVIATNIGGIPEIIEDKITGILVPSRDPEALSQAIQKLVGSTTLRENLGKNLFERVNQDFSFNAMESATEKLYEANN